MMWSGWAVAWGCSLSFPGTWEMDPALVDDDPPALIDAWVDDIRRGRGTRGAPPLFARMSSCDDDGIISVATQADEEVGLTAVLVAGTLPGGLTLDTTPVTGPDLLLSWDDGNTHRQEPLDFALKIIPVDRAGNEGEGLLVEVFEDGHGPCGCASRGGATAGPLLMLVIGWMRRGTRARA